jgi:hypothetical protein
MKTSWYQEPWAWLVFILPAIAVVAGIGTYIIANNEPDTLVIGDYYKKGKAINLALAKVKRAQKLGMAFSLKLSDKQLLIKATGIEKSFPLLNLAFYHPTLAQRDFHLKLTPDGNGDFRHQFEQAISGKWKLSITPFDNDWRIHHTLYLPQASFVDILPRTTRAH